MLTKLMPLAIALASMQCFFALPQQEHNANQTADQSQRRPLQQEKEQRNKKDAKPPAYVLNLPQSISAQPVALPPGDNAWAVQIISRGGFSGAGSGDLTVTSEGTLIWTGADGSCTRRLSDDSMQALTKIVLAADASAIRSEGSLSDLCRDCYVTAMILQRRGIGGVVTASAASWDDATQAKLPADAISVYEAVIAHKGCKR